MSPPIVVVLIPIVVAVQQRKNNIAGREKGQVKREAIVLEKSEQAWLLMNAKVVLPLLQFVTENTKNDKMETLKKKNSLYDSTRIINFAKPVLIKLKTGNNRRINYIFNKVRVIRNDLAHHLSLHKRTIKTYLNLAKFWGKVLDFIGRHKEKQELMASIRKMISNKMKAVRMNKRRPQAAATAPYLCFGPCSWVCQNRLRCNFIELLLTNIKSTFLPTSV